jgi:excinuclease ABC subunit C
MTKNDFSNIAPSIPHEPGVYQYFSRRKEVIYVGKAKDLRKRVSSYFVKNHKHTKTARLVKEIVDIKFTIVNSEYDALMLENTLIKKLRPKYNVALKDDKSYPHIVIKNESFPRVFLTRRKINDGSEYIGPFTSAFAVREILKFLRRSLPLRTCNLNLDPKVIAQKSYKACLQYHIGNCKAPCIELQTEEDYMWHVSQIKDVLKGKNTELEKVYKKQMMQYAEDLQFEKAQLLKNKLVSIKNYNQKSIVVNTKLDNTEVVGVLSNADRVYVNYMMIVAGNIVHSFSDSYDKQLGEADSEILPHIILSLREKFNSSCKEIILPFEIHMPIDVMQRIPKVGDRKKILEMSIKNARHLLNEEKRKAILHIKEKNEDDLEALLEQLQDDLSLPFYPDHIECFDNSNFQGSYPVAGMVCFKNGVPSKKDYRRFNIKTVVGADDFASMREVVFRRYSRLLHEKQPLPQLVVIDGGKGQLNSAIDALQELELMGKINIIGLAKNIEEIFFPGDKESLQLPFESESLKLLRRIRDEVHRFGITFHRQKRSKGIIKNELESIKGIGKETATMLLKKFKSVKKIKEASQEVLAIEIGEHKARLVKNYFSK